MRTVLGKQVYDDIAEAAHPRHTALLVVDLQNDYVHERGHHARAGKDVSRIAAIVPRVGELAEAARQAGVLVVWIKNTRLPNGMSDSPAWLAHKSRNHGADLEYTIEGSWGHELVEPLEAAPGEPVVNKFRSSAFVETSLDLVLRSQRVETVVVVGCVTQGCVSATARSASFHDYYTYLVGDCVASTSPAAHEAALGLLDSTFPVHDAADYVAVWKNAGPPEAARG